MERIKTSTMRLKTSKESDCILRRDRISEPYVFITKDAVELIHIFHPFTQIVLWQRNIDAAIEAYFQRVLAVNQFGSGFRTVIRAGEGVASAFLPQLPGREALIEDLCLIAELYFDLLGCDEIALRLEALNGTMCPRFHVDRTGIRLICTYCGRGTEWINDQWVDREKLGPGSLGVADDVSGLFDKRTRIEAAEAFDVVLVKGALWQGNTRRGAIHRSPTVLSEKSRVLLVMDAIWADSESR